MESAGTNDISNKLESVSIGEKTLHAPLTR